MILRNMTFKGISIMCPLYKALIRPILEYANSVWSPYIKEDIDNLERVQRNFTKRIYGLSGLSYHDRLRTLHLPSIEYRRLRGDLIEVYKVLHKIYDPLTTNNLFVQNTNSTRTNQFKLEKCRMNKPFQSFFTNRIINTWNKLPFTVVSAEDLNTFKNRVDSHLDDLKFETRLEYV